MSFYTSLTGLNAAASQLTVTSNNIANAGTTGFKRSRADFGDIFATSPLQKASSTVGQGVSLKAVTQEFSQGNIQVSANSLDIAISGDGFFPLKSVDGLQDIYTRNGSFTLDDSYNVVNAQGQALMAAAVDSSGKADLTNLNRLQLARKTSGDARETTAVQLGINFPADAAVIDPVKKPFDRNDPTTYSKTTTVTVYDTGGNGYLATVYYSKTQVATPTAPTNKWQTHVYIGDTELHEGLIQAGSTTDRLFVNKYGEVRPASKIPVADISRGINKLYKLDDLKNAQPSLPAAVSSQSPISPTVNNAWKGGVDLVASLNDATNPLGVTSPVPVDGSRLLTFDLSVDGSSTPKTIDLSDLVNGAGVGQKTGVEMARLMTDRINKVFGDDRYLDLAGETLAVSGKSRVMTLTLTDNSVNPVQGPLTVNVDLASEDFDGGGTQILPQTLAAKIQGALDTQLASSTAFNGQVKVQYDDVSHQFTFADSSANALRSITLKGISANRGFLGLSDQPMSYGDYSEAVIPNGKFKTPLADQRYGIQVTYDEAKRSFSVASGRTGDTSSIKISVPGPNSTPPVTNNLVGDLFGLSTIETKTSSSPLRGVASQPAVLDGGTIGVNLSNKFRIDESNNQFVVTVDNVTGVVTIPPKPEYSAEEFRIALESRINALSDKYGRSVSGVKIDIKGTTSKYLEFTTGTTGDNAFLKVSANSSIWGLDNLGSARGSTSTWQIPSQARNANGFPLYVDRNGAATTNPGDFSEAETANLWAPVYLNEGQLTFDSTGKMISPMEPIQFDRATIGSSGASLKFSIDYGSSTQYSSPFTVRKQDQNGRPEGDLIGVEIGDNGLVSASYSNGTQKSLAKIVLSNFANPTGLRQIGDSSYFASAKSGSAKYGEAGSAGFGSVRAGAIERANVDLTKELVELITAQRNFQANAKAIETNETVTQAIINIRS